MVTIQVADQNQTKRRSRKQPVEVEIAYSPTATAEETDRIKRRVLMLLIDEYEKKMPTRNLLIKVKPKKGKKRSVNLWYELLKKYVQQKSPKQPQVLRRCAPEFIALGHIPIWKQMKRPLPS